MAPSDRYTLLKAAIVLIHNKSRRAELADGHVVLHDAGRAAGTGQAVAGVHALVGDAGQVRRTPLVPQADRHLGLAVLVAHAQRLVVQHLALLPLRTDRVEAGVLASSPDAGLGGRALLVVPAGRHVSGGAAQLPEGVDGQLVPADAGGLVVGGGALLVRGGADVAQAGVPAHSPVAAQGLVAVVVPGAASSRGRGLSSGPRRLPALPVRPAIDVSPSNKALRALAPRHVEDDRAERVLAAGRAHRAGVATGAVHAGLVDGAVAVVSAHIH